jgi:uncharacterized Zn finger protein
MVPKSYGCPECGNRDENTLRAVRVNGKEGAIVICEKCSTGYDPQTGEVLEQEQADMTIWFV